MADQTSLKLGEEANEGDWRSLVERGLKGAPWDKLVGKTADGLELNPLYREPDIATSANVSGAPGSAPFIRGGAGWTIRQRFDHPAPEAANRAILADLRGGVGGIELTIDPTGAGGVAVRDAADLTTVLQNVLVEAAPISLDAGPHALWAASLLRDKLKGVAAPGTAFGIDPIGALMSSGALARQGLEAAATFAKEVRETLPTATTIRVDARPVHEAGGTEAQEIAAAISCGIAYLRALAATGLSTEDAAAAMTFAVSVGPDVLIEAAKLRALRLTWARVLEASGAPAHARGARIHAFTSERMMTRYDAQTNILRVTTAAFAAAIAGANDITTLPFTNAVGRPTPFARRVARNTQLVLLEESRLGHVADPAGGAWFVEKLTRQLADLAWEKMQAIERLGGILQSLQSGALLKDVADARTKREAAFARRKEAVTGVTDFPLLGVQPPAVEKSDFHSSKPVPPLASPSLQAAPLSSIRWAAPFEDLREKAEARAAKVFFANLGPLAEFTPRANFARNAFAAGGVDAIEPETVYANIEALVAAFKSSGARAAALSGTDARYAEEAAQAARALKGAGATWVVLAGKPGDSEAAFRNAGVDQFVFVGQNVLAELQTLHAALGVA